MIEVHVYYKDSKINRVELDGHADYDVEGKDLVCAGASTCFLGALSAIHNQDNVEIFYSKGQGHLKINRELDYHDQVVVEVMIEQLEFISSNYPENIKVITKK